MSSNVSRLLLGLAIGLATGLIYGWLVQPVQYIDTAPDTLRQDYRADYVLMVAEAYTRERDLDLAQRRLASLGPQLPVAMVESAILYGVDHEYPRGELETLNQLVTDLRVVAPQTAAPGGAP
jgi:hypothetical protein